MQTISINPTLNLTNYEDLIFLKRNRDYGAYKLRLKYKKSLMISLVTVSLIFIAATSAPLFMKKDKIRINAGTIIIHPAPIDLTSIDILKEKAAQIDQSLRPQTKPMIKFLVPKLVEELSPEAEALIPTIDELKDKLIGTTNRQGTENGSEIIMDETVPTP